MVSVRHPSLYEINTRVYLFELSRKLGRPATFDDVPGADLARLAELGFDWVWFLGVWQTGPVGRQVSLTEPNLRKEYQRVLPDFTDDDVCGSCFAVRNYTAHSDFGGDAALNRLRRRMHARGVSLVLDFVPNHTAPDHPWVGDRPEFYVAGDESKLAQEPQNYCRLDTSRGPLILAYGRDPHFPGWTDTLQLNYGNPALQEAMIGQLAKVASLCDGVRCDMAMLVLPDVFERTWGIRSEPFWPKATGRIRQLHPDFLFMAEAYWDLEWTLQQQGFNYTYDKHLYDLLRDLHTRPARDHLCAGLDFQDKLARFLENHDEPRAAAAFPPGVQRAAAIVTFLTPGLRFFHQGQLEGKRVRIPVQLRRGPDEPVDAGIRDFYDRLLSCLLDSVLRDGEWRLLDCVPAWDGNPTSDCFLAFAWYGDNGRRLLVAVNYAAHQSQCYVPLPFGDLAGRSWRLRDLMGEAVYDRDGSRMISPGLYLDMPAWGYHVFEMIRLS